MGWPQRFKNTWSSWRRLPARELISSVVLGQSGHSRSLFAFAMDAHICWSNSNRPVLLLVQVRTATRPGPVSRFRRAPRNGYGTTLHRDVSCPRSTGCTACNRGTAGPVPLGTAWDVSFPRRTACTPRTACTTKGVNRWSLLQAACSRPTSDFVHHGVYRRRLGPRPAASRQFRNR